jgi:predicted kinase
MEMVVEVIIFIGIQASGKSTFCKNNYFNTHLRISNDLLKTKNREKKLIEFSIETQMNVVIDNTNATKEKRKFFIDCYRPTATSIVGIYFKTDIKRALLWNQQRLGKERIPNAGILSAYNRLEIPSYEEGFDKLYYLDSSSEVVCLQEWNDEV